MEKYIYDNSNGLWYELHGDYYLPCLVIPEEEIHTIGIWGRRHQQYLREHRSMVYTDLVLSGKLYSYLTDIDTQARNKLDLLVMQLAEKEGINEQLKTQDQLAWVRAMNNIRNCAEEIVLKELIYGEDAVLRILEEFWYGNIEPTEYDTSSRKKYKKLLELICRNEEKLQATMTDEQKKLFFRYTDAIREHQMTTDCLIFQNGFKLGARMMLEVMEE